MNTEKSDNFTPTVYDFIIKNRNQSVAVFKKMLRKGRLAPAMFMYVGNLTKDNLESMPELRRMRMCCQDQGEYVYFPNINSAFFVD